MKKLIALVLTLASFAFVGVVSEPNVSAAVKPKPQIRIQIGPRERHNRFRSYTATRIVRHGRRTYRETLLVRHLAYGRAETTLISRERVS